MWWGSRLPKPRAPSSITRASSGKLRPWWGRKEDWQCKESIAPISLHRQSHCRCLPGWSRPRVQIVAREIDSARPLVLVFEDRLSGTFRTTTLSKKDEKNKRRNDRSPLVDGMNFILRTLFRKLFSSSESRVCVFVVKKLRSIIRAAPEWF